MFSQKVRLDRRTFLERSALGFGSAFLLPSLLASCTDHNLPPINPPIDPPLDLDIDYNEAAKRIVLDGLGEIPGAGSILSLLADIFWPTSGTDVWGQIKDQVEALVDQKIDDATYTKVSGNLAGLKTVVDNYQSALGTKNQDGQYVPLNPPIDYERVRTYWRDADDFLGQNLLTYQSPGDELLLLPLFAQYANLYMATYRDAVMHGKDWGFLASEVDAAQTKLTNGIGEFTSYALSWYESGRGDVVAKTPSNNHLCEPFRSINRYDRQMTLTVLDYVTSWQYYDTTKYPNGAKNPDGTPIKILTREIYSDPYGSCDNSGDIVLPPPPTQLPTNLTVWGGVRIDAVQLIYPGYATPRMGNQNGGINQPPKGGSFTLSPDNPITQFRVLYGSYTGYLVGPVVSALQFQFNNGSGTNLMGGVDGVQNGFYDSGFIGYTNEALSSVYINGVNTFTGHFRLCRVWVSIQVSAKIVTLNKPK